MTKKSYSRYDLNSYAEIFYDCIHLSFINPPKSWVFPSLFKLGDITSVFKKEDRNSKCNYRPVSILLNLSNIFERCMF